MSYARDKSCSKENCPKTYIPDEWGTKRANREGWFLQRNGDAWCPDHNPEWVAEWRAKQAAKRAARREHKAANPNTRSIRDLWKE